MSEWIDRIENHPIMNNLNNMQALLGQIGPMAEKEESSLIDYNRLMQIYQYVSSKLLSIDPVMVPISALNNINNAIQQANSELSNYSSTNNRQHLVNANTHADNFLLSSSNLPVPHSPKDVEGLKDAVASFRKSVGQHLRYVEEDFSNTSSQLNNVSNSIKSEISQLSAKAAEINSEIINQKGRLDTAITQFQQQFSTAEQSRAMQFTQAETKRSENNAELSEQIEQRIEKSLDQFNTKFDKLIEDTNRKIREFETIIDRKNDEYIKRLDEYKVQAESLVHVIGNTGMVGGYQKVANEERKYAFIWHGFALLAMIGLIVFAMKAFNITIQEEFHWGKFGARVFVAAAFGILVAYAARQGNKHHENERRSRRMELELASIDPYLVGLPKETHDKVKEQLAERLFGQKEDPAKIEDVKTTGSALDIVKMALETVKEHINKG